jgi:hypothetical protein
MLAIQKQRQFIERTMQLPNGVWAVVVFELLESNGKVTAKAISAEIIEQKVEQSEIIALPVFSLIEKITPVISPYFSEIKSFAKDFSFVISQPTRAPAFI